MSDTFYFLASAGYPHNPSTWATPASAWDNNVFTYSSYSPTAGKEIGNWIRASEFATESLSEIQTVKVGVLCDIESATYNKIYVMPVFSGSVSGSEYDVSATETSGWQDVDITNDAKAPGTWTWNDIHQLEVIAYGENTDASPRWVRIHEYRLAVTMSSELESLVNSLPETIQLLNLSLTKLDEQITAIQNDKTGVLTSKSRMISASDAYLEDKKQDFIGLYGGTTWQVRTSGSYGSTNLTQWVITSGAKANSDPPKWPWRWWSPANVVSGAPADDDTKQYNRQIDFPTVFDHLNKRSSLTGTYGINARINSLNTAKSLTEKNLVKIRRFYKTYRRN